MSYDMEPVEYLTDDRDMEHQAKIIIFMGGNGDYYQQIMWRDEINNLNEMSPAVRVCTSGGASSSNPDFLRAVSDQYDALSGDKTSYTRIKESHMKALDFLQKIIDDEVKSKQEIEDFIFFNRY